MAKDRTTGPRVLPRAGSGPRLSAPQAAPPPTVVQLGGDRVLAGAREVDFAQLAPDPDQPRKYMDPARLAELADSIARHGVLEPLIVREDGLGRDGDMRYTVVAGGRRHAAIRLLLGRPQDEATRRRVTRVPVVINDSAAAERRVLQLIENLQREDLNPIDEARALKEIMRLERLTTTGLAERVHRSQGYIDERLRLLRHEDVEEAVETGLVPKSAGAAIASLPSADQRRAWLERARAGETIRARDIYATKPKRGRDEVTGEGAPGIPPNRSNPGGGQASAPAAPVVGPPPSLPKFGNPDPGQIQERIKQLRTEAPELTGPEAYHLATVEAQNQAGSTSAIPAQTRPEPALHFPGSPLDAAPGATTAQPPDEIVGGAVPAWLRAVHQRLRALPVPAAAGRRELLRAELLALRGAIDALLDRLSDPSAAATATADPAASGAEPTQVAPVGRSAMEETN
jgi:ParB/RepB/Spo0J family partition protein